MNSRRRSSTTWITLLACFFVALLPSGGLALCLGHHGSHLELDMLALWAGADSRTHACPCESREIDERTESLVADSDDQHPPCRDVVIEATQPWLGGFSTSSSAAVSLDSDDGPPPPPLDTVAPRVHPASTGSEETRAAWLGTLMSSVLRDGRTVVLLI
jgi:hypothetical protein